MDNFLEDTITKSIKDFFKLNKSVTRENLISLIRLLNINDLVSNEEELDDLYKFLIFTEKRIQNNEGEVYDISIDACIDVFLNLLIPEEENINNNIIHEIEEPLQTEEKKGNRINNDNDNDNERNVNSNNSKDDLNSSKDEEDNEYNIEIKDLEEIKNIIEYIFEKKSDIDSSERVYSLNDIRSIIAKNYSFNINSDLIIYAIKKLMKNENNTKFEIDLYMKDQLIKEINNEIQFLIEEDKLKKEINIRRKSDNDNNNENDDNQYDSQMQISDKLNQNINNIESEIENLTYSHSFSLSEIKIIDDFIKYIEFIIRTQVNSIQDLSNEVNTKNSTDIYELINNLLHIIYPKVLNVKPIILNQINTLNENEKIYKNIEAFLENIHVDISSLHLQLQILNDKQNNTQFTNENNLILKDSLSKLYNEFNIQALEIEEMKENMNELYKEKEELIKKCNLLEERLSEEQFEKEMLKREENELKQKEKIRSEKEKEMKDEIEKIRQDEDNLKSTIFLLENEIKRMKEKKFEVNNEKEKDENEILLKNYLSKEQEYIVEITDLKRRFDQLKENNIILNKRIDIDEGLKRELLKREIENKVLSEKICKYDKEVEELNNKIISFSAKRISTLNKNIIRSGMKLDLILGGESSLLEKQNGPCFSIVQKETTVKYQVKTSGNSRNSYNSNCSSPYKLKNKLNKEFNSSNIRRSVLFSKNKRQSEENDNQTKKGSINSSEKRTTLKPKLSLNRFSNHILNEENTKFVEKVQMKIKANSKMNENKVKEYDLSSQFTLKEEKKIFDFCKLTKNKTLLSYLIKIKDFPDDQLIFSCSIKRLISNDKYITNKLLVTKSNMYILNTIDCIIEMTLPIEKLYKIVLSNKYINFIVMEFFHLQESFIYICEEKHFLIKYLRRSDLSNKVKISLRSEIQVKINNKIYNNFTFVTDCIDKINFMKCRKYGYLNVEETSIFGSKKYIEKFVCLTDAGLLIFNDQVNFKSPYLFLSLMRFSIENLALRKFTKDSKQVLFNQLNDAEKEMLANDSMRNYFELSCIMEDETKKKIVLVGKTVEETDEWFSYLEMIIIENNNILQDYNKLDGMDENNDLYI